VIFAGTNHGVFYLTSLNGEWQAAAMIRGPLPEQHETTSPAPPSRAAKSAAAARSQRSPVSRKAAAEPVIALDRTPRIRAFDVAGNTWYAATNEGLFVSVDHGRKWYGAMIEGESDFIAVNSFFDSVLSLVAPKRAFLSHDEGKSWSEVTYPQYVTGLYNLTVVPDGSLWLTTREGAVRSTDGGKTWEHVLGGLPPRNVFAVRYDPVSQRLLATALGTHGVFESKDGGQSWQRTPDTGVSIKTALDYQGRLLAASAYNGLLLQTGGDGGGSSETAHVGAASSTTNRQ
jgi:photosystem II stability/assembly factor-like uncharacterized protein